MREDQLFLRKEMPYLNELAQTVVQQTQTMISQECKGKAGKRSNLQSGSLTR